MVQEHVCRLEIQRARILSTAGPEQERKSDVRDFQTKHIEPSGITLAPVEPAYGWVLFGLLPKRWLVRHEAGSRPHHTHVVLIGIIPD